MLSFMTRPFLSELWLTLNVIDEFEDRNATSELAKMFFLEWIRSSFWLRITSSDAWLRNRPSIFDLGTV